MNQRSPNRKASEADWGNSTVMSDLGEPTKPKRPAVKHSYHESKHDLEKGLDVIESDTIPGEFLDFFNQM
jgi:hypothetical protein